MCNRYFQFLTIGLIIFALAGCHGDSPVTPDEQSENQGVSAEKTASSHYCWGLWDVTIDPETSEIETVPLRTADFNANIVRFLQPPVSPIHMLTIALGPGCEPSTGYWVIDVTLAHPFPGNNIFRGFDVRGIIMTEGDAVGIHDPGVSYRGLDGTRLLNPDGYTRWWNMQEFTSYGKILGYTEGARSTPGFNATATVNPYKLFTDDLTLEGAVNTMNPDLRATFGVEPGINKRRYEIQFDLDGGTPPMRFKYAVDASWSLPDPSYAPDYPIQAYDLSANCQEAYLFDVPIFVERPFYESATSYGGDAVFLLTIGDWQADSGENVIDQISHIWVESPTLIDAPIDVLSSMEFVESTHATQATYRVMVPDCHPTGLEDQYFLVTVESAAPDSYMPQIEGDPYAFDWPDAKLAGYAVVDVMIRTVAPHDNFGWVKQAGGVGDDYGYGVTTLLDNSSVVAGCFSEQAIFGEGEPNETVLVSQGDWDIFVARYDAYGTFQWAKHAGGTAGDYSWGITSLSDDSTVVTGTFHGTATFGEGEPNETVLETHGYSDIFMARYNSEGLLEWAKNAGGPSTDTGFGITALTDNSIIVTGCFYGVATFGEGEPGETTLESCGGSDIFISRYNSSGLLVWAKHAGGTVAETGVGITTLSENYFAITGSFKGAATFGEGEPNETILASYGVTTIFIARYNSDGLLEWAKRVKGSYAAEGYRIDSLSDDSTVITGYFEGSTIFGEGETNETVLDTFGKRDIFIAKYNPDGTLAWAKHSGGTGNDTGFGITTLSDGSTVVTGTFLSPAVFGAGEPNETVLVYYFYHTYDIFVARYNPDGLLTWAKRAGGAGYHVGYGITTLSDDSTVVTGYFWAPAIFGPGEPNEIELEGFGDFDIFIVRYYP